MIFILQIRQMRWKISLQLDKGHTVGKGRAKTPVWEYVTELCTVLLPCTTLSCPPGFP